MAAKQRAVDEAKAKLDAYIKGLENKVESVRKTHDEEIRKAEREISEKKAIIDRDVDANVHQLKSAKEAFSHSFGNADHALQVSRARVSRAQNDVNGVRSRLENAKRDLNDANFFNKIKNAAQVAAYGTEVGTKEAALRVAQGVLTAAQGAVDGIGYKLTRSAVDSASSLLTSVESAGDASLNAARAAVDGVRKTQNALLKSAEADLEAARKGNVNSAVWEGAKKSLAEFAKVEDAALKEAEVTVAKLNSAVEKVAFDAADAALRVAKAGMKEIELTKHAVKLVEKGSDGVLGLGQWMLKNVGNVLNLRLVELSENLGGKGAGGLKAKVQGTIAGKDANVDLEYHPGKSEQFCQEFDRARPGGFRETRLALYFALTKMV